MAGGGGGGFVSRVPSSRAGGIWAYGHKPLLDTLLHAAFSEAARQEVPVQFHVGYGDADTDLLLSNPLHLRAVLEKPD